MLTEQIITVRLLKGQHTLRYPLSDGSPNAAALCS